MAQTRRSARKLTDKTEKLLCFKRELLLSYSEKGERVFWDPFLWVRVMNSLVFMSRLEAEQNYQYKQLVAYTIVKSSDLILTYKRTEKGGENRLWNKYSIGIGGHINIDDKSQSTLSMFRKEKDMTFFTQTVWRELNEEIIINSHAHEPHLKCFINDDSDDVGKVHFGMVWILEIDEPKVQRGQKGLAKLEFCSMDSLKENKSCFENWSKFLIDYLSSGKKS